MSQGGRVPRHAWSQLAQQPAWAFAAGACRLDPLAQPSVGSDHDHLAALVKGNLPHDLADDGVVPRPLRVNRAHASVLTGPAASPGIALQDQHDLVLGQGSGRQPLV